MLAAVLLLELLITAVNPTEEHSTSSLLGAEPLQLISLAADMFFYFLGWDGVPRSLPLGLKRPTLLSLSSQIFTSVGNSKKVI